VKTAIGFILTFSIGIWMLDYTQLLAQQTNLDKRYSYITAPKTVYVARQQEAANQSNLNSTPATTTIQPLQNSTPIPAVASQTGQNYSAPDAVSSGAGPSDQTAEVAADNLAGVDNGLWEGCEPGSCCAVCGGGYCAPPCWYTEQGVHIISRSRPRNINLGEVFTTGTDASGNTVIVPDYVLTTKSINYDAAAGYYATVGRYLGRDSQDRDDFLEFTYWGMNTWVDSSLVHGTRVTDSSYFGRPITFGALMSPFLSNAYVVTGTVVNGMGVGGFNQADIQTYTVNSEMHNFELNLRLSPRGRPDQLVLHPNGRWRRECQPGTYISYLVGLRYMTLGDGALWHGQGTIDDDGDVHFITADYNIKTENDLLGLQIGSELTFRRCKWSWGVRAKLGPYINFARDVQEIKNNALGDPFNSVFLDTRLTAKKQIISLIGEVGFEASYRFKPNLIGRAAYDFMWINGLALAPEQYQFTYTPMPTINTNGSLFSHGLTLALEWLW
jgi:hypothetical protein